VNDAVLTKVRALLAKAESTEFPAEAETFTAKAIELIAKHGIDEASLAAAGKRSDVVGYMEVAMESPYSVERSTLLEVVAKAMRCRSVSKGTGPTVGHCIVVGYESDLKRVHLLYSSLLLQAMSQVLRQRPPEDRHVSVTTYRKSWFVGFAIAIRDRFREMEREMVQGTGCEPVGRSTELVLRDRVAMVDDAFNDLFPDADCRTIHARSRAGHSSGYDTGQRADMGYSRIGSQKAALEAGQRGT